jgi:hypothetical protein
MVRNRLSHGFENRGTMRNRGVAEPREERSRRIFQNIQTNTESSIPLILLLFERDSGGAKEASLTEVVSTQSDEQKKRDPLQNVPG